MQEIEAVYEEGVFWPLHRPILRDGQRVRLLVQPQASSVADEVIRLAGSVYHGMSESELTDMEKIILRRHA